jgi:hypothetical protein
MMFSRSWQLAGRHLQLQRAYLTTSTTSAPGGRVSSEYWQRVARGELRRDEAQIAALPHLDQLSTALEQYEQSPPPPVMDFPRPSSLRRKARRRVPRLFSFFQTRWPSLFSPATLAWFNQPPPATSPHPIIDEDPFVPGTIVFGPPAPSPLSM